MHSPSALTEHVSPNLPGFFFLDSVVRFDIIPDCVNRDHPEWTSAKIWYIWTLSLPLVRIPRNLSVLLVLKIWRFLNPPPPQSGRPL